MPIFEYRCQSCAHEFETLVSGSAGAQCPSCQSEDLRKLLSAFAVGGQSQELSPAVGGCGTCGDPRGPGACKMD